MLSSDSSALLSELEWRPSATAACSLKSPARPNTSYPTWRARLASCSRPSAGPSSPRSRPHDPLGPAREHALRVRLSHRRWPGAGAEDGGRMNDHYEHDEGGWDGQSIKHKGAWKKSSSYQPFSALSSS